MYVCVCVCMYVRMYVCMYVCMYACMHACIYVYMSRRMGWAGHVARMGEERGVYRVLVGKPEGKRPMERPRRRWVDNIRMDLQEV